MPQRQKKRRRSRPGVGDEASSRWALLCFTFQPGLAVVGSVSRFTRWLYSRQARPETTKTPKTQYLYICTRNSSFQASCEDALMSLVYGTQGRSTTAEFSCRAPLHIPSLGFKRGTSVFTGFFSVGFYGPDKKASRLGT